MDVIIAHDKPRGAEPGWNRKNFPECFPNQDRLQRPVETLDPKFFFHDHLHWLYVDDMWHSHNGPTRDMHMTKVFGLHCDPDAAESKDYHKAKSWWPFDTEEVTAGE